MRSNRCIFFRCGLSAALIVGLSACAAKAPLKRPTPVPPAETAVPTVPPAPPTPPPESAPLPTRPVAKKLKATKGHPIGPIVTFIGAARADGSLAEPEKTDKKGIPTYRSLVGSGFIVVVEAKPGPSGLEPGRQVYVHVPNDPKMRPDLEIEANRNLGNGSREVCDRMRPNIGGIPAINPPSFAEIQRISDTLNDLSCRFETFVSSDSSCTLSPSGDYSFAKSDSTTQWCLLVARAYAFPVGETLVSVRVRDTDGNPGPVAHMRIVRPPQPTVKKPHRTKEKKK